MKAEGFDRVFIALHGRYGEDGQLQGALDCSASPTPGSGVLGSALGMDKFRTKLVWQQLGMPTPPFEAVLRGDDYEARVARDRREARPAADREAGERRLEHRA